MAAGEQSGDLVQRGTEKAEPTKVQGSGIGPKQCPRKWVAERGRPTELGRAVRYWPTYVSRQSGTEEISRVK